MSSDFIFGNVFSFLSALCILVSVVKQSKKDLILWQTFNLVFYFIAGIFFAAYPAMISLSVAFIRNILSYKNKLTYKITILLCAAIAVLGVCFNNNGIMGFFPLTGTILYSFLIYTTKNEQQMRYALIYNQLLWLVYNTYIMAYPSALTNAAICAWSVMHIVKNYNKYR